MITFTKTMLLVGSLSAFATLSASAATVTFVTPSGATESGGNAVNASATITTGSGAVQVTLNNLEGNPITVAQAISGFFFTLSGSVSGLPGTVTPAASLIDISSGGGVSADAGSIQAWGLTTSGAQISLNSLVPSGPAQTILGPGPYTNANGSIAGNGPHNPFINQTATFSFAATGVTADTVVSNVIFGFGTAAGNNVNGGSGATGGGGQTPEPGTTLLAMTGVGLLALSAMRRSKRA